MRDKINNFLNCLIGAFIGVFLSRSVYTYWDYKTHPELYAMSSAPWYTTILLFGIVSGGIILAAFIVKFMIGKKLTFQNQIFLGVVLIAAANALAFIFRFGIFTNIAWILYGLLFLINPVYPKWYHGEREKAKLGARIAGVLCILVGFLTRFIV